MWGGCTPGHTRSSCGSSITAEGGPREGRPAPNIDARVTGEQPPRRWALIRMVDELHVTMSDHCLELVMHREGEQQEAEAACTASLTAAGPTLLSGHRTPEGAKLIAPEDELVDGRGRRARSCGRREEGYELVAYGLSNHYRQIFTVAGLTDWGGMYGMIEKAQ